MDSTKTKTPRKWEPLAGGISDGKLLVVVSDEDVVFVTKKKDGTPGYETYDVPIKVLLSAGLKVPGPDPADLGRRALLMEKAAQELADTVAWFAGKGYHADDEDTVEKGFIQGLLGSIARTLEILRS